MCAFVCGPPDLNLWLADGFAIAKIVLGFAGRLIEEYFSALFARNLVLDPRGDGARRIAADVQVWGRFDLM